MTTKACKKSGREHTPIVSEKQRGLFGAEYRRRKEGKKGRMPGITKTELKSHLEESGGKKLPKYAKRSVRGSPPMTGSEMTKGYRSLGRGLPPMTGKPQATENRGEGY